MDYIIASVLKIVGYKEQPKVASYDIMCQWAIHLLERLQNLPPHIAVTIPEGELRYAIPKYHIRGHREADHSQYNFNLLPGVGKTEGEEVERNWSRQMGTAASTREMGPGSRHDTLEDHFNWNNEEKYIRLGESPSKMLSVLY